jgi:hypothetical protein
MFSHGGPLMPLRLMDLRSIGELLKSWIGPAKTTRQSVGTGGHHRGPGDEGVSQVLTTHPKGSSACVLVTPSGPMYIALRISPRWAGLYIRPELSM